MPVIIPSKIPNDLLWHYTDFNGFNSMRQGTGMRQGTIYASDINYDRAEFKHLFDVEREVFKEIAIPYKMD
jgi:hypothetical protein